MQSDISPRPTASWLIAIILLIAAMHWIQVLAAPVAFSLFLLALVLPVQRKLEKYVPTGVAVLLTVLFLVLAAAGLLFSIGYGISVVSASLAPYAPLMQDAYLSAGEWLESQGLAVWPALAEQFRPTLIFGLLQGAAARINAIAGFLTLRWTPFVGQVRGLDKLVSGFGFQAAS